jgi:hypothetical protein
MHIKHLNFTSKGVMGVLRDHFSLMGAMAGSWWPWLGHKMAMPGSWGSSHGGYP